MGTRAAVTIAIGYGIVTVLAVVAALWIGLTARGRGGDVDRYRHNETAWMGIVVAILVVLLAATIVFIPYDDEAKAEDGARVVEVEASQYAWRIQPSTLPVGVPIEFRLRSRDVNHGFGIYDDQDRLKKQVQVLPGETQSLVYTFAEPGRYRILCLEFCGVAHHGMIAELEVTG